MQEATCDIKHATCSIRHAGCNFQHAAYNIQHATCRKQHAACDIQHAAYDTQHTKAQSNGEPPLPLRSFSVAPSGAGRSVRGSAASVSRGGRPDRHPQPHGTALRRACRAAVRASVAGRVRARAAAPRGVGPDAPARRSAERSEHFGTYLSLSHATRYPSRAAPCHGRGSLAAVARGLPEGRTLRRRHGGALTRVRRTAA
jgi:hypothetical protein